MCKKNRIAYCYPFLGIKLLLHSYSLSYKVLSFYVQTQKKCHFMSKWMLCSHTIKKVFICILKIDFYTHASTWCIQSTKHTTPNMPTIWHTLLHFFVLQASQCRGYLPMMLNKLFKNMLRRNMEDDVVDSWSNSSKASCTYQTSRKPLNVCACIVFISIPQTACSW